MSWLSVPTPRRMGRGSVGLATLVPLALLALVGSACGSSSGGSAQASAQPSEGTSSRLGSNTVPVPSSVAPSTTTTTTDPGTTTTMLSASAALVQKQPPAGGYQVQVPPVWHYANATIPSDHVTNVWSDPATPGQSLTVVGSGCIGCVERSLKDRSPDPSKVMPAGANVTQQPDAYTADYQAPSSVAGSVDFGRVMILHRGTVITGYVRLDAILPSGDQPLAERMFESFALASPSSN